MLFLLQRRLVTNCCTATFTGDLTRKGSKAPDDNSLTRLQVLTADTSSAVTSAPGATPQAPKLMLSATAAGVSTMENSRQCVPASTASRVWPALWGLTASAMLQGGWECQNRVTVLYLPAASSVWPALWGGHR
jgi:hypothetical protein